LNAALDTQSPKRLNIPTTSGDSPIINPAEDDATEFRNSEPSGHMLSLESGDQFQSCQEALRSDNELGPICDRPSEAQQSLLDQPGSLIPPADITMHLVDVFFSVVHPQFRLLHRPSLERQLCEPSFMSERGFLGLLSAIFALSARYSDNVEVILFDQSLYKSPANYATGPDMFPEDIEALGRRYWKRGMGFMQQATKLLQFEIATADISEREKRCLNTPCVRVLQAAALLSFAELGQGPSSRAHTMVSLCTRMAYDLELNAIDRVEGSSPCGPATDMNTLGWVRREELRRLWWCIWDLDSFINTAKCRPRHLCAYRCQTKLPVTDTDWFESHEVSSLLLPSDLSRLRQCLTTTTLPSAMAYRIVSCHLLSTLIDMATSGNLEEVCDDVAIIQDCVKAWKESLPDRFHVDVKELPRQSDLLSDIVPMYIHCEL
jgi:hypothetical protein